MTNERKKILAALTVITLLGMTALTWFRGDYSAVAGYDFATSLRPFDDLTRSLYLWDERLYAGSPSVLTAGTLPYFLIQYLLEQISGSLYKGQMVFFTLLLVLPGLGMYWFLQRAFDDSSERVAIAFFGAVFYMFNTFVVVKWNRGELLTLFSYGLLPVFLALTDRGLRGPLTFGYWVALIVAMFFFPASLGHTADFLIVAAIVVSFALWRGYLLGPRCLKRAGAVTAASVMLSLWWAMPLVFGMSSPSHAGASFTGGDIEILHYYSSWATLLNLMKMWFFSMYATTVEFSDQFYRPGTLIFPILAFSALLFRKNGHVLFFSVAAVIGLWLSKGTAPPLSVPYEWMYLNVPYFFIFRAPSRYFPVIYTLAIAVLIAFVLGRLFETARSWWPGKKVPVTVLSSLALSLFFFHSWPLFSRDAIFRTGENNRLYPSIFLDLPEEYARLDSWLRERDGYFRLHSFNNQAYLNYTWGYSSTDISTKLLEFPQTVRFSQELVFGSGGFQGLMASFDRAFWSRDYDSVSGFLGLFSSRYITVTNDVMRRYLPDTNAPEVLATVLALEDGISAPASVLSAKVYENTSALPHIYAAPVAKAIYGGTEALLTLSNTPYIKRPALILMEDPEKDGARLPAGSVDEFIFADSNLIDLAAGNVDDDYRIPDMKDAGFNAYEPGGYIILARKTDRRPLDVSSVAATLDGIKGEGPLSLTLAGDGIRWKTLGIWEITTGPHHLGLNRSDAFSSVLAVPLRVWSGELEKWKGYIKAYPMPLTHLTKTYLGDNGLFYFYSRGKREAAGATALRGVGGARVTGYSEDYTKDPHPGDWVVINDAADMTYDRSGARFDTCLSSGSFRALKLFPAGSKGPAFDPEVYPLTDVEFEVSPEGFYDIVVSIGIDDDGDGTMDEEIEAARYMADGRKTVYNLSDRLKERYGYPGRESYSPVWMALDVKKAEGQEGFRGSKNLTVKRSGFYHEVPLFTPAGKTAAPLVKTIGRPDDGIRAMSVDARPSILTLTESAVGRERTGDGLPRLQHTKISPTQYVVDVDWGDGAQRPFWLVFNESYNDGWKAYVGERRQGWDLAGAKAQFRMDGEFLGDHETINGYANGWWVEAGKNGRYRITIEFVPQRLFYRGALISASAAALLVIGWPVGSLVLRRRGKNGG